METVQWKVEGMDCSNCALSIHKYLEKEGMKNVKVNFASGDVVFEMSENDKKEELVIGIKGLGYQVAGFNSKSQTPNSKFHLSTHLRRFLFCLPFTVVLTLDMIPGIHIEWLMNPWIQLALSVPVYITGMAFFGKSAYKSLRNGLPNMNVLIALGATAAFVYSLYGTLTGQAAHYMFYETAAAIITLVFLGNYLEDASIQSTQKALKALEGSQKIMANMIAYDNRYYEHIFPVENTRLKVGDLILIKSGEQVPMDCKILWGDAQVSEAIITGESIPVNKSAKDKLIGGSILNNGTVKAQVTAVGKDTVLAGIISLVKQAQGEKSPVQQLADKISAIFVPVVLCIAVVTLGINWVVLKEFTPALMRSIAVLVIACPCAMGLATPAAIAVGLGRGARNGILFRNATSLELFKSIKQVVFDKTGTLTTGAFTIAGYDIRESANVSRESAIVSRQSSDVSRESSIVSGQSLEERSESTHDSRLTSHDSRLTSHDSRLTTDDFKKLAYSIEKYSNHPIAKCITKEWRSSKEIRWRNIEEVKGLGMKAEDDDGNIWWAGSFKMASAFTTDDNHNVYIVKNSTLIGWIDVKDELRPEAKAVIQYLHNKNIKTILLSGDRSAKCNELASQLSIDTVFAEQSPEQKLQKITELVALGPTAMVGDGINDAPALAKATIGISMNDASQITMLHAQVVLMNHGLKNLPAALGLGKQTYITIKQNLFWAFAYNIVAIPVAALGFLSPAFGALVMGLSDVVLAINSARLFVKKVA